MGQRHALTTPESWVELRDPAELLAGDLMDIEDRIVGPNQMKIRREMTDGVIRALVVAWSLPLPVPSQAPEVPGQPGSLRLISIRDYNTLKKLVEDAEAVLFPGDPEPEDPQELAEAKADEASPTGDADAS
jgi:hypothetical protein